MLDIALWILSTLYYALGVTGAAGDRAVDLQRHRLIELFVVFLCILVHIIPTTGAGRMKLGQKITCYRYVNEAAFITLHIL